jgi:hypothetical protein
MLSRFGELGLLKSRGKARTDSTHILARVLVVAGMSSFQSASAQGSPSTIKIVFPWAIAFWISAWR